MSAELLIECIFHDGISKSTDIVCFAQLSFYDASFNVGVFAILLLLLGFLV